MIGVDIGYVVGFVRDDGECDGLVASGPLSFREAHRVLRAERPKWKAPIAVFLLRAFARPKKRRRSVVPS